LRNLEGMLHVKHWKPFRSVAVDSIYFYSNKESTYYGLFVVTCIGKQNETLAFVRCFFCFTYPLQFLTNQVKILKINTITKVGKQPP